MQTAVKVNVTKLFTFEMAHALLGYDGDCRNIHGHSYRLQVTVRGQPLSAPDHPKDGMVMDFGDLKKLVNREVIDRLDHALVLNEKTAEALVALLKQHFEKIVLTPFQPTCENLLLDIVARLRNRLPRELELFRVILHETATAYAEWCCTDEA